MPSETERAMLEGPRDNTTFRYELLTTDEEALGYIDGVRGGSLTRSAATAVRESGTLDIDDVDGIDWLSARVRIWISVTGAPSRLAEPVTVEWPLGVFVPAAPVERWQDGYRSLTVELLGKLAALDQDRVSSSVSLPAGTVVTDAVTAQITAAGQPGAAVTPSPETLRSPMVWEPRTSRLRIINDLLEAVNYASLRSDGWGRLVAAPYVRPAARPEVYRLHDGVSAIYEDDFQREQDLYTVPNRFVAVGVSSAEEAPLVGMWENTDPNSPTSIPRRGYVIEDGEDGVEATSVQTLTEYARRRLISLSSPAASITVTHAPIPLDLLDVVSFRREPAGIAGLYTVQAQTLDLDVDGLADWSVTLREVVDV